MRDIITPPDGVKLATKLANTFDVTVCWDVTGEPLSEAVEQRELEQQWYLYRGGIVAGILVKNKGLIAVPLVNDGRFEPHPIMVGPHGQEVHLFRRPDNWPTNSPRYDGWRYHAIPYPGQRGWKPLPGSPNPVKAIAAPDTVPVMPDWAIELVEECKTRQQETFGERRKRVFKDVVPRVASWNQRHWEGGDGGRYEEVEVMPAVETGPLIKTLRQFMAGHKPPSYVVGGLWLRGDLYCCTAMTGSGKTAFALMVTEMMANKTRRRHLGPHKVKHGRVVYIACENAADVRRRIIGMLEHLKVDIDDLDLLVIDDVFDLEESLPRIHEEVEGFGGDVSLVFIDTSAAMFQGLDENNNKQVLAHAKQQRELCKLPGSPCVVALTHPTKSVNKASELQPRGGGAYVAEVDGNFTIWLANGVCSLSWNTKLRGPDFEPVEFKPKTIWPSNLKDEDGSPVPTVIAELVTTEEEAEDDELKRQEHQLLAAMKMAPTGSMTEWAKACEWFQKDGTVADKAKVQRVLRRLEKRGYVANAAGGWKVTKDGKNLPK